MNDMRGHCPNCSKQRLFDIKAGAVVSMQKNEFIQIHICGDTMKWWRRIRAQIE